MPDVDDDYDNRFYNETDSLAALRKKSKHGELINPDALFDDPEAEDEDWEDDYEWEDK